MTEGKSVTTLQLHFRASFRLRIFLAGGIVAYLSIVGNSFLIWYKEFAPYPKEFGLLQKS